MNQDKNKANKIVIKKKDVQDVSQDKTSNLEVNTKIDSEIPLPKEIKTAQSSISFDFKNHRKKILIGVGGVLLLLMLLAVYNLLSSGDEDIEEEKIETTLLLDTLKLTVQQTYSVGDFLLEQKVPSGDLPILEKQAAKLGFESFLVSDRVEVLSEKENGKLYAIEVIPKANKEKKVIFNIQKGRVILVKRDVEKVVRNKYVVIDSSLFQSLVVDNHLPYDLIAKMEEILGYNIDFFHLKKGDWFKVIYEEKVVDGQLLGVDHISAIVFSNDGVEYDAYSFLLNNQYVYFDNFGKTLTKKFLMSPLQYGKLTSAFNLERLHPVTGELKPHFGTDYAAPEGTPILSVADGVIINQEQTSNNGNYVKVRHDNTYETQYLHMSAFVQGLKVGSRVKQGQVIGFVGQTGLATGPHVCFRFWKNGAQVDHRKEKLPTSGEALPEDKKSEFDLKRDALITQLKTISG